ncbi:hypothetical protein CRUP_035622 [Coryphaenoides rupestris]|nr:hypothetical protein CRUP_035622 [Coryphaenoides rupestris]
MDQRDSAPDSWDEDAEAPEAPAGLSAAFAALNVNAKPFVPNVNAAVFVPSFLQGPAEEEEEEEEGPPGPDAPLENGGTALEMETEEETWVQKEEPRGEGGVKEEAGACCGQGRPSYEEVAWREGEEDEMMEEEEEEELPVPKVAPALPDAPKKEHVNVVFIGHVFDRYGGEENSGKIRTRSKGEEQRDLTEKKHFTILDAPGHKSFVPNMIGGASQADLAVLVISARKGEFETGFEKGGQTREHAMLAKTAGVKHLIVLVNKMDDPTVNWSLDRYLTGMVEKRTLEKYEREAKEKNRETWAYFETEKKHFTILDAPGHKSFVPNMIGGASQADLAVLVISARKGEFETGFEKGGQTREHAMLAKTAGVKHLIVLVNKMDDPTKVGFNPKKDVYFMPCSGLTGSNLKDPVPECTWYT